jgi:exodeoxyribonuclease V beta subunit
MSRADRPLALAFPLRGSRLIEASAGTGKTYTISALYLRLILGHGGEAAFRERLLPPQILVVTFTDAATRELRDRIRARLVEGAAVFRGEREGDDLLRTLLTDFPQAQWPDCARRLELAAQWMDEAAVSTIHGWCYRMLHEHAFDSGSLFNQTLETDQGELLAEVVRDYWRQQCYPLEGEALAWVHARLQTPDVLGWRITPLLGEDEQGDPRDLAELLAELLEGRRAALARIKSPWRRWLPELRAFFDAAHQAGLLAKNKLGPDHSLSRLQRLGDWCFDDMTDLSFQGGNGKPDYFKRFTLDGLQDACKKGAALEMSDAVRDALQDMETLQARLQAVPGMDGTVLRHAAAWVRQRLDHEKRRRAEMGFDDMLVHLDEALRGASGPRLAEVIRRQFPVAMIDEFQDTDTRQYRIFDRIYQVDADRDDCGLFMIGDPKQAIYAFRGADIYAYLRARRATQGRHYSLDTNFRSSHDMVAAVNRVFRLAEEREAGQGAFLFREGKNNELPFTAVRAQGRKEAWTVDGRPQPALTFWFHGQGALAKGSYQRLMAEASAGEIARLLALGQQGRAGFDEAADEFRPLQPSDVAVLVRDIHEARAVRAALDRRGVRSVYLSDKDSVFDSQEAHDVLLWLRACAEPEHDRPLRAALASTTLGLGPAELESLNLDEHAWERRVEQFRAYRQCWQRQGVLPMLHRLLHDFHLPRGLMSREEGERILTNLLHLAELMQQASVELDGEQALIRHLSEQLAGNGQSPGEQVLRLESDDDRVRVVTIYKSKGLEYSLVFLPFICDFRGIDASKPVAVREGLARRLVFDADGEILARAERERLGEDLRLLYVALTRARYGCWLGVADRTVGQGKASVFDRTALGYLLGGGEPLADGATLAQWLEPFQDAPRSVVVAPPDAGELRYRAATEGAPFAPVCRQPRRAVAERWWIASYSALLHEDEEATVPAPRDDDAAPDSPVAQNATDDELPELARMPLPPGVQGLHGFPRGAQPGTFLHGLLEMVAMEGFDQLARSPDVLRDLIARRCQRRGWMHWVDTLHAWLSALLTQPFAVGDGRAMRLDGVAQYQSEMEFWFEASRVDTRALDALVRAHELPGLARPALMPDTVNGMFKGFIDLAFEHEGRYYVADYKSNWLGADETAYTREAMEAAIASHRYDLQYVLYVLALHRQLRLRLPDYDYDRHMGGALYLFLRAPAAGVYLARPKRALIERLDALFLGEKEARTT